MTPEPRVLLERDIEVFNRIIELLMPFPQEQRSRILAASMIITGITPMDMVREVLNA